MSLPQLLPSTLSSLSTLTLTSRTHFPTLSLPRAPPPTLTRRLLPAPVRMGGGPRTYPGGVSKWQWKRMQAKKAKQLLKARLLRERHLYETRKRAELKAAVAELEKPWELVEKAPTLFSVSADEQVKVLADRFQRPGGFDMWSDRDGPQVFNGSSMLPSQRFFPEGAVHSVRPYGGGGEGPNGVAEEFDYRSNRRRRRREGVRRNEDEKNGSESECIDVEARLVGSEDDGRRRDGESGSEDLKFLMGGGSTREGKRESSYSSGSSRRIVTDASRIRHRGGITLRPTANLNSAQGRDGMIGPKVRGGGDGEQSRVDS